MGPTCFPAKGNKLDLTAPCSEQRQRVRELKYILDGAMRRSAHLKQGNLT
jgi:hypothetical protein